MELVVEQTNTLKGVVKAPPSKSYTIRAIIAASLAEGRSEILGPLYSDDTKACIECCGKIGSDIEGKNPMIVAGICGNFRLEPETILDALNSGTTIRLMTGICSLSKEKILLTGDESIQKRPIGPLLEALERLGVKTKSNKGYPPHSVRGPIKGGTCKIRGDISSQFISSLLMATPLAENDTTIEITTPLRSRPYVDLTLDVLEKFGVSVENREYEEFYGPSGQSYSATNYRVEGDYSSAAFVLGAAALTSSDVTVKNLFKTSKQADKKIAGILEQMGARVVIEENRVRVTDGHALRGITVDLSDAPDLVPIVSVLGALAEGRTVIENVEHARLKECDRIRAMATELKKMGCSIEEKKDGLVMDGGSLRGTRVHGWKDHRIVMALAIAALRAKGKTSIDNAEYIDVTFPNFVKTMKDLGALIY